MPYELYYTSAERGLKAGTSGYCTLAATVNIPPSLVERLESISSYQPLFPASSDEAHRNPVAWSHFRLSAGGKTRSVLSRIGPTGLDYTRRPNTLAYHLVIDTPEQPPAGPAWLISQPGVMSSECSGPPQLLQHTKAIPYGDFPPRPCQAWGVMTGDAGWAGALANSFMLSPTRVAHIICTPDMQMLPLLQEAIALLPPRNRWQLTFSTYFNDIRAGQHCAWRCVIAGTSPAVAVLRQPGQALVMDLTQRMGGAPDSPAVDAARTGAVLPVPKIMPSASRLTWNSEHV